ncbi:MAG: 23S rRNA (adenine(2030)-N(6))-methyltransferase RlmJ [Treponema sp.]|nr:23S rRNA (adenine(2030)-N(6))-methyltransferase RlmJ [Treponema sp.]
MLSYRHGFHAGNAADVLKHGVLVFCLDYLRQKEKPFLCVDTYAGAGLYHHNREWKDGVGKLLPFLPEREKIPSMPGRYLEIISRGRPAEDIDRYPGSPLLMEGLLREQDRLVCFELHPEDFKTLVQVTGSRTEVRQEDGPGGLKALLPPPSRRGLVFIDPSWEEKDEYESIPLAAAGALKRFPGGIYIIWYPLLASPKAGLDLSGTLLGLHGGRRCRAELHTASRDRPPANSPRGMYGSGLVVYNPPWTLRPALEEALPFLASVLGGCRRFDWYD